MSVRVLCRALSFKKMKGYRMILTIISCIVVSVLVSTLISVIAARISCSYRYEKHLLNYHAEQRKRIRRELDKNWWVGEY